ncbi:MAG: Rid family detoxifying hydrolase [Pseudomonadota bacterium]
MAVKTIPDCLGPYSHVVESNGLAFFSGQLGIDPNTNNLRPTCKEQLDQILINMDALLTSINLKRSHIIKSTIFLADLNDFALVNEAYKMFFQTPYPARSTIQVAALPKGAKIEIEFIGKKNP